MKTHARVVVIGGGALGAGLLYFLTKEGWDDVVLVEKGELTSGSTWHAAGLVPHFIGGLSMAKLHHVGSELYKNLERETGQATGWHGCGAILRGVIVQSRKASTVKNVNLKFYCKWRYEMTFRIDL